MKTIVIFGATSAMAIATARRYAQDGHRFYLLARNQTALTRLADDLRVRGAHSVHSAVFDAEQLDTFEDLLTQIMETVKRIDICLLAHGLLPDQKACEQSLSAMHQALTVNGISCVHLLTQLATIFEQQQHGTLAVITSVAGDRGRQSNYVYSAAKALVSAFLQGLTQRLHKQNVQVLDIRPGFVDTPMTAHLTKGALWAKPDAIAQMIVTSIDAGRNVRYTPAFWWFIMQVVKNLPTAIFKRLTM